jgi:glycosyltransferase involved in cell wall biosynthesis
VSCSYLIERKRVDLFLDGLIDFSKNNQYKIEWFHIGKGPMLDKIYSQIKQLRSSVKVHLLGNLGYEDLISFYKSTPIDLFVNTSAKEGTPVSLMEAISFGIPLLVTSFGGNKEIVSNNSGFLLSENPTPKEISNKLNEIIKSDHLLIKRKLCFQVWNNYYNSSINYKLFTEKLINIQ